MQVKHCVKEKIQDIKRPCLFPGEHTLSAPYKGLFLQLNDTLRLAGLPPPASLPAAISTRP